MAAIRRQEGFLHDLFSDPSQTSGLDLALRDYQRFLWLLKSSGSMARELVPPSVTVDLMWHVHMMCPTSYHADCERLLGFSVDHDDNVEHGGPRMEQSVINTVAALE